MKQWKKRQFYLYGIQNRFLKYVMVLLTGVLFLFSIGIGLVVRSNVSRSTIEKYEYINEKIGLGLENEFKKTDKLMKECILHNEIQKSLRNQEMDASEQASLNRYFSYLNYENILDYVYIDNKSNIYKKPYGTINFERFEQSGFDELLGEDYAKTKWIWTSDTLFQKPEKALFIGSYVRNMDYKHAPGMLFFKIDSSMFAKLIPEKLKEEKVSFGIVDANGKSCYTWKQDDATLSQESEQQIISLIMDQSEDEEGGLKKSKRLSAGVISSYYQKETGFIVFTFIPNKILNQITVNTIGVMLGIYLFVLVIAAHCSVYFSKRFTKPIKKISSAMSEFNGEDFTKIVLTHTHTELDTIGYSYNKMLLSIKHLLQEIKMQERELRTSELNSLIHQINPHFLYNTLDTIYMLARINKEETTMKMIQALSKFLKISLSKGNDTIWIQDEIEHVKSYMEIQKIRNEGLFTYEIECQVEKSKVKILKLILQPLVENAIKHGFSTIYEDGIIRIYIFWEEEMLVLKVYNNGIPIKEKEKEQINHMKELEVMDIKKVFSKEKEGYGVANIASRLRLKYGNNIEFYFKSLIEGTECTIKIPRFNLEEGDANELL